MSEQHTPGPWRIRDGLIVANPTDPEEYIEEHIGVVYRTEAWTSGEPIEFEEQANAALIAASPTMYDYIAKRAAGGDSDASAIMETIHAPR